MKNTQKSAKNTTATGETAQEFTDEERRHVADRLRADGVDRRRRGKDQRARAESSELTSEPTTGEEPVKGANESRRYTGTAIVAACRKTAQRQTDENVKADA